MTTPKFPPPPPNRPVQIGVLALARVSKRAVGGYDVDRKNVVDRESVLPGQPAEAAPEREARDTGRRVDSERGREAERLRLTVEISQRGTRLDPRRFRDRIDSDGPHARHVEHDSAVANRVPRDVVPASPDRERQVVLLREADAGDDVTRARGADDHSGTAVDHRVPDRACRVVSILSWEIDGATYLAPKLVQDLGRKLRLFLHQYVSHGISSPGRGAVERIAGPTGER